MRPLATRPWWSAIGAVSPRIEAHIAWLEQELSDLDKGTSDFAPESSVA